MKRLLLALLLTATVVQAQSILRNSITTNVLGTNLTWNPSTLQLRASGATPSIALWNTSGSADGKRFDLTDAFDQLRFGWLSDNGGTARILGYFDTNGNLSILATGTVDGVVASNSFRLVSGGGASKVLTSDANGVGTWQAASGGDTTGTNIVTLTQTGTNISQMDFALVQNGGAFKLSLTNNGYMTSPANVVTTSFKKAWLIVQQPSTGTCILQFTNGVAGFAWSEGVSPVIDTNNGSVAVFEFVSDVFTNGLAHGALTRLSKTATNL